MDMDLKLLLYFDKKQILFRMSNECQAFLDLLNEKTISKFLPFRYLLEIDVMELLQLSPELGELLMNEPLKWQQACNGILYACLKTSDNQMNQHVRLLQVAVNIRLKSFPHVFNNGKLRQYSGIDSSKGLLVNISKHTNYVYHTVWSCPEECEGNEVILQFIPKTAPKCYLCRSTLYENSGLRRCGDKVEATFLFKTDLLPRSYTVTDDLVHKLKLGAFYFINAVVLKKTTVVWSLEEVIPLAAPLTSPSPPDIRELLDACDHKPWKFIYCLASSIGAQVCPLDCFMNVKMNLLLSVASIKVSYLYDAPVLHCLAAGPDTGHVAALMRQASLLADTTVVFGTSNTSVATSLIGASGGICVMPLPLQIYNQKQLHSIVSAIETGEIHHDNIKVKLNCAVWAHGMDLKKIVLYDIARVFGNICRSDYTEITDELADFILQKAIEPQKTAAEQKRASRDISMYIDVISGIRVTIDEHTQNVLSKYFLAARRASNASVWIGNMESLVAACAMSARLCRRAVATPEDAILAIWLHVSGMREPRLAPDECLQTPNDIIKLSNVIDKFALWLQEFSDNHIISNH